MFASLKVRDVDNQRMTLRIEQGRGAIAALGIVGEA
jgi:hypothetical protein